MLVLTRRIGDEIIINGHIRLKVTAIRGERVLLGVAAPPEVRLDRAEVHRRRHEPDRGDKSS